MLTYKSCLKLKYLFCLSNQNNNIVQTLLRIVSEINDEKDALDSSIIGGLVV